MSSIPSSIIFLLGAGASKEAGIPMSADMIEEIELLLTQHNDWTPYRELYNHVKSAIYFSAGLKGKFKDQVPFNIETLVNSLYELERNEEHPLYPFIASWNSRFVALASVDFSNIRKLRQLILRELKQWMCPEDASLSKYYNGFVALQRSLNYPLQIFSLNYDLCVEGLNATNFRIETGFPASGPNHLWDWERFESSDSESDIPEVYLYKLHGSINWKRNEAKNLYSVNQIQNVAPESMEVIFGRDFKLEAADPYLFYAYQFRKFTLEATVITVIGYGFLDSHINKMITQALRTNSDASVLLVARCNTEQDVNERRQFVAKELGVAEGRIRIEKGTAASFLNSPDLADKLIALIPKEKESPF